MALMTMNGVNSVPKSGKVRCARDAEKRRRIKELEAEIERMEGEMSVLQEEMASPEVCADYQLMNEKCAECERLKNLSAEYSDEWIMLCEELDI